MSDSDSFSEKSFKNEDEKFERDKKLLGDIERECVKDADLMFIGEEFLFELGAVLVSG